jgi:hypothetical protein
MRRIMLLVTVALVMAAMMVAMAMPAFADKGGSPQFGSCGAGRGAAQSGIQNPESPGATEIAHLHPHDTLPPCTG